MSADITPAAPPPTATLAPVTSQEVNQTLWSALVTLARRSAGADDSRKSKDFADAAADVATIIIQLDPNLIAPQGVPPEVLAKATPQQERSPESHTSRGPGG